MQTSKGAGIPTKTVNTNLLVLTKHITGKLEVICLVQEQVPPCKLSTRVLNGS